jgi:hypothetical protein
MAIKMTKEEAINLKKECLGEWKRLGLPSKKNAKK